MSSSDIAAQIRKLSEDVRFAELRLKDASVNPDSASWNDALAAYRQAVQALTAVATVAEIGQKDRKIATLERQNHVLAQRREQLKEDLDYTEQTVANLLVSIREAHAAAEEVRGWTTAADQATHAANHIVKSLPDPDADDPYQLEEDAEERCYGIHLGSDGYVDCEGKPI